MKLFDLVKDDNIACFRELRGGNLWYEIEYGYHQIFEFPIPIEDTKGAVFMYEDKAVVFLKWIRRQLEVLESA